MAKAKPKTGLRAKAIADSKKFANKASMSWYQRLEIDRPEQYAEIVELVKDWAAKDRELRAAYPSARTLAKFICSLDYISVRECVVRNFINGFE